MAIEKITKEELLEKLGEHILSDEELEKITGGGIPPEQAKFCADICSKSTDAKCLIHCLGLER